MGLIKDIYSQDFYNRFADAAGKVVPAFDKKKFITAIFDKDFAGKEWKDRMKHTTRVLHQFLPADYPKAVKLIEKIITQLRKEQFGNDSLPFMFFPDYIETYGLDDFDTSCKAFTFITQFISCEFAVRPFVLKYGDRMLKQMLEWSLHEKASVRRLASEGSRPRLPWAMALPALKKDPLPVLPILENLKKDPSDSVRRSVANNLNDIAKDHPQVVMKIAVKWKGISRETDAIIKHGCRTLLKQGHAEILKHYGLNSRHISLSSFKILTPNVRIGGHVGFSFSIRNESAKPQTVRLEYGLYYNKANGQLSRKIFKISEKAYPPKATASIERKQSFRLITTRKFYAGLHKLSIVINGEEKAVQSFKLIR